MLGFVIDWALFSEPGRPTPADPMACPNCGKAFSNEKSPYCSPDCREEAAFVRHIRSGLYAELIENQEKQSTLGQVFWTLIGGGFPLRQSTIPEKTTKLVMARHGGKCELCDTPATKVDHIRTGCNRPINLRPVCDSHQRTRPFGDPALLESVRVQSILERLAPRIVSPQPLHSCDDAATWDWRAFLNSRKANLN